MLIGNYKKTISKFIDRGYQFIDFNQIDQKKDLQIILRHDIDLDINIALEMAKIENKLNINSTYFFLLTNESYNLISEENLGYVKKIRDLGHSISLHFDIAIYKNAKKGLDIESAIFNKIFEEDINIISIHRPSEDFLKNPLNYFSLATSYDEKFTKNINYFSDSGGSFKYGHPIDSKVFKKGLNIQLLIHPIWWINSKNSINETVNNMINNKKELLKAHFQKNIKTFK